MVSSAPSPAQRRPSAKPARPAPALFVPFRELRRQEALQHRTAGDSRDFLHPYQREAVDKVLALWKEGEHLDVLVWHATGLGKTEVALAIMAALPVRTLCLVHKRNLVTQMAERIKLRHPEWSDDIGLLLGGRSELDRRITVGTIQTLAGNKHRPLARLEPLLAAGQIDLLVIDECHHSLSPSYIAALAALRERNPKLRHVGLTATPTFEGKHDVRHIYHLADYRSIRWAVENGYLVPPQGLRVTTDVDLSKVRVIDGDFEDRSLGKALNTPAFNRLAVKIYRDYLKGLRTIAFCATVAHAKAICEEFNAAHLPARLIVADTKDAERQETMAAFVTGEVMVLVNVNCLVEGVDIPAVQALLQLRPTRSSVVYTQAVGRALRLAPGKSNATIVDFTTNDKHLFTLDNLMDGKATAQQVDAPIVHRGPRGLRVVSQADTGPAPEPRHFWTEIMDLLRRTPMAWYGTDGGISTMPLLSGYAMLVPPGGSAARARLEELLAQTRAGARTGAKVERLEWQLAHLDCYVVFHIKNNGECAAIDWDRDYSTLISVASTWAEQRKSPQLSMRGSQWRGGLATEKQISRLLDDHTFESQAWLTAQETLAGARLSRGLASCFISYRDATRMFRASGFAMPPRPEQTGEERAIRLRRLLLEQGIRAEETRLPAGVTTAAPARPNGAGHAPGLKTPPPAVNTSVRVGSDPAAPSPMVKSTAPSAAAVTRPGANEMGIGASGQEASQPGPQPAPAATVPATRSMVAGPRPNRASPNAGCSSLTTAAPVARPAPPPAAADAAGQTATPPGPNGANVSTSGQTASRPGPQPVLTSSAPAARPVAQPERAAVRPLVVRPPPSTPPDPAD